MIYIEKNTPTVEAVCYDSSNTEEIKKLFESRIVSGGFIIRKDDNKLLIHLPSEREFYLSEGEYLCWEHEDFYCHCEEYMKEELKTFDDVNKALSTLERYMKEVRL
jgi:hypothetical protein